ncbi:hypothetical protein BDV97DRAFT_394823 [Delphinella strobiligena]|nr:hypothetical protein BDV97DRAFT_394823 [Delphinella strobiligena]
MARPNDDGKRSRWSQQSHPSLTNENFNWSVPGRGHVTQFTALSGQIDPPDNENAAATTRASRTDSVSQPSIPSFQWVPIDPRQSVDKSTMRNLRSHVMNNYLQKEQQNPNSTDTRVRAIGPYRKRKRGSPPSTSSLPQPGSTKTRSVPSSGDKATSKSIITGSEEEEDLHHAAGQLDLVLAYRSESDTRRRGASKSIHAANLVPETNLNLEHRVPWDISWPRLHPFLDRRLSHNPFRVSPRFENPEIDVDSLKRTCINFFGNHAIQRSWLPMVAQTRRTFLSSLCASTAYLDAMQSVGSQTRRQKSIQRVRTRAVFEEVLSLINRSMNHQETRTDDATIIAIIQLLCGEMMMANDAVLPVHEQGLWSMVMQRGGLTTLGNEGEIAALLVITVFEVSVFQETQPRSEYVVHADHIRRSDPKPNTSTFLPESPLYCPSDDYTTVTRSKRCSDKAANLLRLTRDLTGLAIEMHSNRGLTQSTFIGPAIPESKIPAAPDSGMISARLNIIVHEIFAFRQSQPDRPDRIYDVILLCARLYASAIWYNTPLSTAGHPAKPGDKVQHIFCGVSPSTIRIAILRTDLFSCWDEMIGVLLWVVFVAGAASHESSSADTNADSTNSSSRHGRENVSATGDEGNVERRWFIALAMRCSILLSFEHTAAVTEALRKLLTVQDLLGRGPRGTLES